MGIFKRKNGITLIALVITIIVLLILAGISMSIIIGENALFPQSRNAKIKNEFGAVKDAVMLKLDENIFENYNKTEENKTSAIMKLFNEGYIDYEYIVDLEKFGLEGLELGYGNLETGDYYSLKNETLTYIDKEKNSSKIIELKGIGEIPINLYFVANIDQTDIKFDINMESTLKFTLSNYDGENVTYEDIDYEISMKNKENSSIDLIMENINLSQENYQGTIQGKTMQTKEANLQIKVKNGKSLSNETIELVVNIKEPLPAEKTLKIDVSNDNIKDYSGNNYNSKLMNGAKIVKDEENNCAIEFDGIDDFVEIPTISGNFNWKNGLNIEVIASVEELNNNTSVLTLGNGLDSSGNGQEHIIVQAAEDGSKIKFEVQAGRIISLAHTNYSEDNSLQLNKKTNFKINLTTNFLKKYQSKIKIDDVEKSGNGQGEVFSTITPIREVDRTQNYIGKSYWGNGEYFKGKIYYLKVTDASGKKVIEYDLNHME